MSLLWSLEILGCVLSINMALLWSWGKHMQPEGLPESSRRSQPRGDLRYVFRNPYAPRRGARIHVLNFGVRHISLASLQDAGRFQSLFRGIAALNPRLLSFNLSG